MSPLHQEEEVLPIVSREEFDLMTRVIDEQPILGSSVSGQRCIRSAGALPLAKYHPYVRSNYFKGQLRGLPSSEAFRANYLRARRTGRSDYRRSGREADDECSGVDTGCIEGFSEAENCKENLIESRNTISLFFILKKCNQVQTFLVMPFKILGKV